MPDLSKLFAPIPPLTTTTLQQTPARVYPQPSPAVPVQPVAIVEAPQPFKQHGQYVITNVGPGASFVSDVTIQLEGAENAVIVEVIPSGLAPSATFTVLDSDWNGGLLTPTADAAYVAAFTNVTGYTKRLVTSVNRVVAIQVLASQSHNGNFMVYVTPIVAAGDLGEQRFNYTYISTQTTTVVKAAPGVLHGIIVTGGTAGTIIIYDNASGAGTVIANFDSTVVFQPYIFDVNVSQGITIVTGAATKITVLWR